MSWGLMHPRVSFFWDGGAIGFLLFPTCSDDVPNMFPNFPNMFPYILTLFHILSPKFYSCNLYELAKGGDYNITILELSKVWLIIFVMSNQRCPSQKKKIEL
jgi:hypothetical protein